LIECLIQAKSLHYGFDFCPAFWDWLTEQNRIGKVASIAKVAAELSHGNDQLAAWAEARGNAFFHRPDALAIRALSTVSDWAHAFGFLPFAVEEFLLAADC